MDTHDVTSAARQANDHPLLENAARLGYAVNGVLHLLIGWIGFQLAWANPGGPADQSGALQQLAQTSLGRVILWLAVVGFFGLAVWQVTEVIAGWGEMSDRVKAGAKAVVYLFLGFSCLTWAKSQTGSDSAQQTVDFTTSLMHQTAGRVLVAIVGIGVVGVGGYHVYKGWKQKFLDDLEKHPGTWAVYAGRAGYIAKGIALGLVGGLFFLAAVHNAPDEATGLDGALKALLKAPSGQVLLTVVALGLVCYAVYSFARARHAKV